MFVKSAHFCSMAEQKVLRFVRLSDKAQPPTFGSENAAGADLHSVEKCLVPAKGQVLISTGLSVAIPPGHYGRVAARSGLAVKHSIAVGAGVIDSDYRGELKVLLFNHSETHFQVNVGDRVAQLICESYTRPKLIEVDRLEETKRNANGFGSTGGFANGK